MKNELESKKDNLIDIEAKVSALKQKLVELQTTYTYEAYKILKEIFTLRKSQIENYSINSLSREKGIDLSEQQVAYIFGFEHFSDKSWKLIEEEKVKPSTVLFFVRKGKKFREPANQNQIVKKYMDGEINITRASNLNAFHLLKQAFSDHPIEDDEKFLLRTIYQLKSIRNQLDAHKASVINNPEFLRRFKLMFDSLNNFVEKMYLEAEK